MEIRLALLLHLLSVVVWVGGMFFAYMALRPAAAATLPPPQRLPLWVAVFSRFFPWVWLSIVLLLLTGFYLIHLVGGMAVIGRHVHIMLGIGVLMMLIFGHVYFAAFAKLKRLVAVEDWPAAGKVLGLLRILIGINLSLGLLNVIIVVLGR